MHSTHKNSSGFTLIELVIAVAIIGILTVVAIPPAVSWAGQVLVPFRGLENEQERVRQNPNDAAAHPSLGDVFHRQVLYQDAIAPHREAIRIRPDYTLALWGLGLSYEKMRPLKRTDKDNSKHRLKKEPSPQPPEEPRPRSGTGSGFFVSRMGYVITNAHVVRSCDKVTVGDNANKQVSAEVVSTDRGKDLALLKLPPLEMASAIQKLGSKGLLRSDDVRLGESVLVAGYPFGDAFSNTIKVTAGIVSATRGAGDDSGQFQLDAAVQPGNSGGPIYDSSGNIVGAVISRLDKLKVAKAIGSMPENVNFGIKASTVRRFLVSSGLPSRKSGRTKEKSTEQLAEIAQNQTLMVMCLRRNR